MAQLVLVFVQLRPSTEWTMPTLIQKDPHRPHQFEPKINYHDWPGAQPSMNNYKAPLVYLIISQGWNSPF